MDKPLDFDCESFKLILALENYMKPGIFGFFDHLNKKVIILHSNNILKTLAHLLTDIKSNKYKSREFIQDYKDKKFQEFIILDEINDYKFRLVRLNYWCKYYMNLGYSLYNNYIGIEYKLKTIINQDGDKFYIYIKLISVNKSELTIGVFDNKFKADWFIDKYYPDQDKIYNIVYSTNDLTKKFHAELKNNLHTFS